MDITYSAFIFRWRNSNLGLIRKLTYSLRRKEQKAEATAGHFPPVIGHKKEYTGSVQRLLDKKIVSACPPLKLIAAQRRQVEEPRIFERQIFAIWIAKQCHQALKVMLNHDIKELPYSGIEANFNTLRQTNPDGQASKINFCATDDQRSRLTMATIPIYAVL